MRYAAIIAAVMIIDQATKLLMACLGFDVNVNAGTAFGLFAGFPLVVTALAAVALVCMLFVIFRMKIPSVARTGLAFAAGGAASNIIDRIMHGGALDWLRLPFSDFAFSGGLRFNIADVAIGLGLLAAAFALYAEGRR